MPKSKRKVEDFIKQISCDVLRESVLSKAPVETDSSSCNVAKKKKERNKKIRSGFEFKNKLLFIFLPPMQTTGRALVFLRDAQAIVPFTVAKRNMEHVVLNAITIIAK